jgi:signal transduction histidine kinase
VRARPLQHQLFALLVVPALLVVGVVAYLADEAASTALEAALADRLTTIAQASAALVGHHVALLERGDDESRLSQNALAKLDELRDTTKVARIIVLDEAHQALVDTDRELKIGDPYLRARFDVPELERVASGETSASVLFEGKDGRPYKTGYAPLLDEEDQLAGYVAVAAAADYTDALDELRAVLGGIAALGLVLLILAATMSARRVAIPLSDLSQAAQRIGRGQLDTEIPIAGPAEAVVLGETMRSMTASLCARDEEMQMMLAGIAHEVRNPLGGIELFGGLLREDLEAGDPRRKHVDKILRELGVLARVVNDFLDFARQRPHQPVDADVHELLFDAVSLAEKDASEKGVTVALDAPKNLSFAVDAESLERAVLNLLKNAIQAAPQGGQVRVTAVRDDGLQITVSDNGPGVPEEKRKEIFTPFFTTKQKGTGLGLALVLKTVIAHGGTIDVDTAEEGGARFVLRLPVAAGRG